MSTKKYYWLRQPSTFFQDPKIKKLRRIAGGDTYTIIYQKIMLLSIVNGGVIHYEKIEDSLAKELALILDEDEDNVKVTLSFMQTQGLIEEVNNDDFLLPNVPSLIGCESDSAERVRRFRENKALQCNTPVISCNTEIEKEIELKKELDRELETKEITTYSFSPIKTFRKCSEDCNRKAKVEIDGKIYCGQHGRMLLEKIGKSEIFPEEEISDHSPSKVCDFDLFWSAYPKKEGKGTAQRAWNTASKLKDFPKINLILQAIDDYKKTSTVAKGFIKNPTTWINGKCWLDETPKQVNCWADNEAIDEK